MLWCYLQSLGERRARRGQMGSQEAREEFVNTLIQLCLKPGCLRGTRQAEDGQMVTRESTLYREYLRKSLWPQSFVWFQSHFPGQPRT